MLALDRQGNKLQPKLVVNGLFKNQGQGIETVKAFEYLSYPVVNRAQSWLAAKVKALTTAKLAQAGVPHPPTIFTLQNRPGLHLYTRRRLGLPVVLKPWQGAQGVGVTRYRTLKGLRNRLKKINQPIYLQRFVRHPGRDIRVMVMGNRVPVAVYRVARRGRWKTNVYQGAKPVKCEITPPLAHLALAATQAVGLDIAGVDVVEYKDRLYVLEVNAWPNYDRYIPKLKVDIAQRLAKYLIQRL